MYTIRERVSQRKSTRTKVGADGVWVRLHWDDGVVLARLTVVADRGYRWVDVLDDLTREESVELILAELKRRFGEPSYAERGVSYEAFDRSPPESPRGFDFQAARRLSWLQPPRPDPR